MRRMQVATQLMLVCSSPPSRSLWEIERVRERDRDLFHVRTRALTLICFLFIFLIIRLIRSSKCSNKHTQTSFRFIVDYERLSSLSHSLFVSNETELFEVTSHPLTLTTTTKLNCFFLLKNQHDLRCQFGSQVPTSSYLRIFTSNGFFDASFEVSSSINHRPYNL